MKAPFEEFHLKVGMSTLIILETSPSPVKVEDAWKVARWVEDAIREKMESEK
jgi:hypothetical protein